MKLYYVCLAAILQVVSSSSLAMSTPLLLDQQDWLQKPTLLPIQKWQQLPGDPNSTPQQKSTKKNNGFFEWQDIYSWMNTPYFMKGQIQGWFFPSIGEKQPVKNSEPDNQHRGATALTENEETSDSEERPEDEENQNDNPFGSMSGSMMASFMETPGSDMTSSIREQINTFTITPDNQMRIDSQSYPNLSRLVEAEGSLLLMSGTLPPSLLYDMEEHITRVLAEESTSIAELPLTHQLRRWLRWLRSSSFTYTYKRIYEQHDPLNSAMLKRSYYNLDELIVLYNLIDGFDLTQEALSDIFKTFLTNVITEEFSLQDDELTLHIMEHPSLLALILLCYHSSVLRVATEQGKIQFSLENFQSRRMANREHLQDLILAMNKILASIITERRRDRAIDATIYILSQEPQALLRIQTSYREGGTPATVNTNVLETLNRYARDSPLNSSQAAMVVFSLLHMPCIIPVLNWLESHFLPYSQLISWISNHHNSLVRHTSSPSDIPVLYAALNSVVQSANSSEVVSGTSQSVPEELSNFVDRWVQGVEGPQTQSSGATPAPPVNPADIEADDFEVVDSTQTTTTSLNPQTVLNTLIQMHPDLLMDLNTQLALETEPETRKKIVKAALEKLSKYTIPVY